MPKRETSKRRGWFSWGRSPEDDAATTGKVSDTAASITTPPSSPGSSVPNSPSKNPPVKQEIEAQPPGKVG